MSEQATPAVTNTASPAHRRVNTRRLAETAIMIAVAMILAEFVKPFQSPFGGGISICGMVPIILVSYRWGVKWGFFSAFVFGVLQLFMGIAKNSFAFELWLVIIDVILEYILAYTLLGLGGIFRNRFKKPWAALTLGGIVAVFARYFVHFIAGFLIWGTYATEFFTEGKGAGIGEAVLSHFQGLGLAVVYSGVYNGALMLCEMVITVLALFIIGKIPALSKKMD